MKIVVPTHDRPNTIKTTVYLHESGVNDYLLLLNDEKQADAYIKGGRVHKENIVVTHAKPGINFTRQFVLDQVVPKGEWFITLDDNISNFTGVAPAFYRYSQLPVKMMKNMRAIYNHKYAFKEVIEFIKQDIELCEKLGFKYGGFSPLFNQYFRSKKYHYVGYLQSKAAYINNCGLVYDENLCAMEEYGFNAEHLLKYNGVLLNKFLCPKANHYEKGGIGPYEKRLPRKIADCQYLMLKYPGLFRFFKKKNCHPEAEIVFTVHDQAALLAWKRKRGLA